MTPASKELSARAIPHREFVHPGTVHSLEQAAEERGQSPEQVLRSIVFRIDEGQYIMVVTAGPKQLSWPALRKILGLSRMAMASPEEVLSTTGYAVGSVSPLGLPNPMRILLDRNVLLQDEVSIGSGERGTAVILKVSDLVIALEEPDIFDF